MEEWHLWFLAGIGAFLLIVFIRQHFSLWNLALAWIGFMLFSSVIFYATVTGRPVVSMVLSLWLVALGSTMWTTGVLNQKHGRTRFPEMFR